MTLERYVHAAGRMYVPCQVILCRNACKYWALKLLLIEHILLLVVGAEGLCVARMDMEGHM